MHSSLEAPQPNLGTRKSELSRFPNGGLLLYTDRPDFTRYRLAGAANLTSVLNHIGADRDLLLMTPFSGAAGSSPSSWKRTEEKFRRLPGEFGGRLGSRSTGAYWLIGHWTAASSRAESENDEAGLEYANRVEYYWLP